ncbi:small subunit ribosomal protein S7 [Methanococcus maripaludis]|uniref:Small ribosomal subunit protein uS7 n=1 Tax=Methanococcus maripaludis TaxID=39152 RepID=A0A7J9P9Z9_METMI|nr:30S ribosomal protein S7 [Methanococcus maripaludis]MBA2839849.1 small subunit ribosomal protein S7 [Methanococcus maripaludis]MBA2852426.1 small subunit ribosomal protein S7 [Methanococcus maripaludis]MBA2859567.1 small subunit ribosomal protein S7 [Methanococcus maripaludis]MBA2868204.1 small subunit ribosomal protein S7 [Methanococcus maripaludis]MBB6401223.1 small subunit ribosomal protein S7 [Methanococcus maripaludis]
MEIKLFGKWDSETVAVKDPSLKSYISVAPVLVPHTAGRNSKKSFDKSKMNIVERLANKLMANQNNTGKKHETLAIIEEALTIIENRTKENPVQVLVDALENSGPREETTRISYGGIAFLQSVDVSPSRRLDTAFRNIALGASQSAHKNKKTVAQCLADEIIFASKADMQKSFAVKKKEEKERVAQSAR